jgi:MFS family permease
MHFEDPELARAEALKADTGPWYKDLSRYHWFVLIVAALGWMFDTMDQQLFTLARKPAIRELNSIVRDGQVVFPTSGGVAEYEGYATMIFMLGWAIGGLFFGVLGDRIGRAKTMLLTILTYSAFTGLSAVSWDFWSFSFFRFLTGLGVGGEFAVGVSLVAEVIPDRARSYALGWVQAMSAVGNMTAAIIGMSLGKLQESGVVGSAWRIMFLIGMAPALLAVLIRRRLKEPGRPGNQGRVDRRAFRQPSMAEERDRRDDPRFLGRRRPLGDRLLQLRTHQRGVRGRHERAGAFRRSHQGSIDVPGRPDVALSKLRWVLWRLCVHALHGLYRAEAGLRDFVLAGDDGDVRHVLLHQQH